MKKNNLKGWLYLLPAIVFLGIFMVYPLVDVFVYAFQEGFNFASQTYKGVGWYNFSYVLRDPYFLAAVRNTFIIFLVSGLWHGASCNFIVWGLIHGAGITLSKLLKGKTSGLPKLLRQAGTFIFVNITWVFFRAPTLNDAMDFFRQFTNFKSIPVNIELVAAATPDEMQLFQWLILSSGNKVPYLSGCIIIIGFLLICTFISMYCRNSTQRLKTLKLSRLTVLTTVILLVMSVLSLSGVTEFIYENF